MNTLTSIGSPKQTTESTVPEQVQNRRLPKSGKSFFFQGGLSWVELKVCELLVKERVEKRQKRILQAEREL